MSQQDDDEALSEFMESFGGTPEEDPPKAEQLVTDTGLPTVEDFMPVAERPIQAISVPATDSDGDDLGAYLEGSVVEAPKDMGLSKPWMKFHKFTLVKTVDEVRELVDRAVAHGQCSLDLETEGFDNRINYDAEGKPYTVHKIVGFCISVKGHGHYIPIRHKFDPIMAEKNPNVTPVADVEAEIARLCQASQPILTPEGQAEDPLGSSKIATPGKLVIGFWHSKFDQEFLFPITGLDFWHPESFEDGYLAAYSVYSDDDLGLKGKANERLSIEDPDRLVDGKPVSEPYTMIEFAELFPAGTKVKRFQDLYPEDGNAITLYGCSDAICTELLCFPDKKQWEHTREGLKYSYKNTVEPAKAPRYSFTYRLEKQTAQAVRDMERRRTRIDKKEILALLKEATIELEKQHELIVGLAQKRGFENFNPASTKQLAKFLFEKDGLDINPKPKKNEASGEYKTDAATLEAMAEAHDAPPVLRWIVTYRQIEKIIGTYLQSMADNCDDQDQLRFKFNQTGAATGRFTAPAGEPDHGYSGIPIQGIPARNDPKKPKVAHSLRRIFIPHDGYTLVKVDYAGQELRIVANLSGEPKWVNEFLTARSEGREADLHTLTAKAFFGEHITRENTVERNAGKIANFSLIYGGGTQAVMRATKCDKVEAARRKANFDRSVPVFAGWVTGQHAAVKKNKGVSTAFKRFIAIPDANVRGGDLDAKGVSITPEDARKIQAACERKSTNFPIQGSGADIMKISLVKLVKEFHKRGWRREGGDDSVRMIMTVHDEIVFEVRHDRLNEAVPLIIEIMESPSKMVNWKIPLVVEPLLGLSWNAKYDWVKIQSGEDPVPEWLEGILEPGKVFVPKPEGSSVPTTAPATPTSELAIVKPAAPTARAPSTPPPASGARKGIIKVAVFALSNTYLTARSVDLVFEAAAGSIDSEAHIYLRLVDNSGNILIDPTHQKVPISPDKLRLKMQDRNLGSGEYELKEEAV